MHMIARICKFEMQQTMKILLRNMIHEFAETANSIRIRHLTHNVSSLSAPSSELKLSPADEWQESSRPVPTAA